MKQALLSLFLFFTLVNCFSPNTYSNSTQLTSVSDEFQLFWRIESEEIFLAFKVKTTGWIAFGLAEPTSGSMPGADIVHGFVDENGAEIVDSHALDKVMPVQDDCQDWGLISGEEEDGFTIIEVVRKLTSDDVQDRGFSSGTMRVIWAYGADGNDVFGYHASKRGATGVAFYGEAPILELSFLLEEDGVLAFDFLQEDYEIPAEVTHYGYTTLYIPFDYPIHMIGIEHVIDPNTIKNVHHFVLRGYYDLETHEDVWEWAPGIAPLILPSEAGFRAGPGGYAALVLETHYDNPEREAGLVDNSGLKIYYTANLRTHDAGVLILGDAAVAENVDVESGLGFQSYEYSCPSECTSEWPHSLNVFSSFLHMHATGSSIYTTLHRGDEYIMTTNRIEFWDSNFQQQTPLNIVLQPGDRLNTHCTYKKQGTATPFGQGSHEEMCMDFVSYWPKIPNNAQCSLYINEGRKTFCNGNYTEYANPLVSDPVSRNAQTFGVEHPEEHTCPDNDYIQAIQTEASEDITGDENTGAVTSDNNEDHTSASDDDDNNEDDDDVGSTSSLTLPIFLIALTFLN